MVVGYAGGQKPFPNYRKMLDHTEAVRITYDTQVLSYEQILRSFFTNQSGGPTRSSAKRQYRSAILVHNLTQKALAHQLLLEAEKKKKCKIYVDIEEALDFYRAEEYHQKWFLKH